MKRFVVLISEKFFSGKFMNRWKIVTAGTREHALKVALTYSRMYPCGVERDATIVVADVLSQSKANAVRKAAKVSDVVSLLELDYVISRNVQLRLSPHWIKFTEWLDTIKE